MLTHDVRHAMRLLAKSKVFAAVAIVSLALALALNTTAFVVLDAFMHPFVPYRDPQRLVVIQEQGDPQEERITWEARRAQVRTILSRHSDSVAYYRFGRGIIRTSLASEVGFFADVTPQFFTILGVGPALGRGFIEGEDHVVLVSHSFWLRELGGRRKLDGTVLGIDQETYAILGVMPPGVSFPLGTDVWRLVPTTTFAARAGFPIVRLNTAAKMESLLRELDAYASQLAQRFGVVRMPFRYKPNTLLPDPYDLSHFHVAMVAAAAIILLIACANLANLMVARGMERRRELAIRLAIGASRAALVRQLVAEAALLALAGGGVGTVVAAWGVEIAQQGLPHLPFLPPPIAVNPSWTVYAYGLAVSCFTVVLFGLLPALQVSRVDINEPLKDGGGTLTTGGHRYSVLAATQVALALTLLMSGAVLLRSARNLSTVASDDPAHGLAQMTLNLPPSTASANRVQERFDNIIARVSALPGVSGAAAVTDTRTVGNVAIPDDRQDSSARITLLAYRQVSPGYARIAGMEIIDGRDLEVGDARAGGAALVNEVVATALWPNRSPLGHSLKLGAPASDAPWYRIVGVVRNSRSVANIRDPYLPQPPVVLIAASDTTRRRGIIVRVADAEPSVLLRIAQEIQNAAALSSTPLVWSMGRNMRDELDAQEFATGIFVFLGITGLCLAAVGLYGVLACTVSRRSREFGVRMAIGATNQNLFAMVLHDGAVMVLAGTAIGAFAAMASTRLLDAFLYGVHHADASALVISEALLCAVALLACVVPARRAMHSNPIDILRAS